MAAAPARSAPGRARAGALAAILAASAAVLASCVLASFRLGFADDLATLLRVNGPRVMLAAGAGSLLALSGALRLAEDRGRPLRELELLALGAGAAAGGFALASAAHGAAALALFGAGALAGAAVAFALARALDRPRRSTNLGCALLLVVLATAAALAGTYARARSDTVAPAVQWLLGDLQGARFASGAALLVAAAALLVASLRAPSRRGQIELVALALGTGAVGPLAFVGTFAPRAVRALAGPLAHAPLLLASAAAGAATVAAIDAVPRLLVGGYDFPWNVPAAMLAIPVFLGWNRARLRREVGPASRAFEIAELALIAALTAIAAAFAFVLARVIASAT